MIEALHEINEQTVASSTNLHQTFTNSNERLIYDTKTLLASTTSVTLHIAKMLFSEEDTPLLKNFIVKRLENTYVKPTRALHDGFKADACHFTGQMRMRMSSQTMFLRCYDMMET